MEVVVATRIIERSGDHSTAVNPGWGERTVSRKPTLPSDRELESLFDRAVELVGEAREQFLEALEDSTVRAELHALLECDASETPLLDPDPIAIHALLQENELEPGQRVGHYRLIEPIGEGGMGVVYRAEQDSPKRTVALKVMRSAFPSQSAERRFEHESQVLGLLEHPNIARVFEAGTATGNGQRIPFFAMEFVQGVSITKFVTIHSLDTDAKLELFQQICEAVQHAHQKGVIHRDLKPANILVDESGRVKVLDFGVARVFSSDSDDEAAPHTYAGQILGTVQYMSPEQASGDPDLLDTRSDVYSLGVVLFELLAGSLPNDVKGKTLHEAISIIKEVDALSLHSVDRAYRGDLATIVAKALAKERDRRYQTVSEFSADLRRYRHNEPISARPASTIYLLTKYTKRHRAILGAMAVAIIALSIGTVLALREKGKAELAAIQAQNEATRANEINQFLMRVFTAPSPDLEGPDVKLVDLLVSMGEQVRVEFAHRKQLRLDLLSAIARALNHNGMPGKAIPFAEECLADTIDLNGEEHTDTVDMLNALADIYSGEHDYDRAKEILRRSRAIGERILPELHPRRLSTERSLARLLAYSIDPKKSLDGIQQLREVTYKIIRSGDPSERRVIIAMLDFAPFTNDSDESEQLYVSAIESLKKEYRDSHPLRMRAESGYAHALMRSGEIARAEALFRDQRARLDFDRPTVNMIMPIRGLADCLVYRGEHAEAATYYQESTELIETLHGKDSVSAAASYSLQGACLIGAGDLDGAKQALLHAWSIQLREIGPHHPRSQSTLEHLITLFKRLEKPFEVATYEAILYGEPPPERPTPKLGTGS